MIGCQWGNVGLSLGLNNDIQSYVSYFMTCVFSVLELMTQKQHVSFCFFVFTTVVLVFGGGMWRAA